MKWHDRLIFLGGMGLLGAFCGLVLNLIVPLSTIYADLRLQYMPAYLFDWLPISISLSLLYAVFILLTDW